MINRSNTKKEREVTPPPAYIFMGFFYDCKRLLLIVVALLAENVGSLAFGCLPNKLARNLRDSLTRKTFDKYLTNIITI